MQVIVLLHIIAISANCEVTDCYLIVASSNYTIIMGIKILMPNTRYYNDSYVACITGVSIIEVNTMFGGRAIARYHCYAIFIQTGKKLTKCKFKKKYFPLKYYFITDFYVISA